MTKRSRLPWLIIGGIIIVVILVAALFLYSPSSQPVTIPAPAIISSTDFVAPTAPRTPILYCCHQRPEGTALIDPSSGHGHNACITGDVTELRVSVNGAQKGMPGRWSHPGAFRAPINPGQPFRLQKTANSGTRSLTGSNPLFSGRNSLISGRKINANVRYWEAKLRRAGGVARS
jgi:hypothetical protein